MSNAIKLTILQTIDLIINKLRLFSTVFFSVSKLTNFFGIAAPPAPALRFCSGYGPDSTQTANIQIYAIASSINITLIKKY